MRDRYGLKNFQKLPDNGSIETKTKEWQHRDACADTAWLIYRENSKGYKTLHIPGSRVPTTLKPGQKLKCIKSQMYRCNYKHIKHTYIVIDGDIETTLISFVI